MKKQRIDRKQQVRKAATLALCGACASITVARNPALDSEMELAQNILDGPPTQGAPGIMQLEAGRLIPVAPPFLRHRIGINYRPMFNVSAQFQNVGFPPTSVPPPGGGAVDRFYDDGYVRPETTGLATGSPDGYTSYWSYQNSGQVVGNNLLMSSASSAGTGGATDPFSDGPQQGFEMSYSWVGGPAGPFVWGVEGGFGFSGLNIRDGRSFTTDVNVTTDAYDISNLAPGGGPPPPPGTPSTGRGGTSALILVDPASRSVANYAGSTINGYRDIDANVFDLRVGPYAEYSFTDRFSAGIGAGLAVAFVNSTFSYEESLALPGGDLLSRSGNGTESDTLIGPYVSANLAYTVGDAWQVFGGAQFRSLGTFEQSVNGASVKVDFGNAVYAIFGVGFSF